MNTALPCKLSKKRLSTHSAVVCLDPAQKPSRCWPKISPRHPSTPGHSHKHHACPRLLPHNPQQPRLLSLSLDTNLKSQTRLVQPRIVRRLTP